MTSRATLAYCAGVIDSDGTIGVKRSTYSMRHGQSSVPLYSERICVKQVSPEAVDLLHSEFGGSRYLAKGQREQSRPLHTWQISDLKAARALKKLLPFLRIKAAQARVCLLLRKLKSDSRKQRTSFGRGHVGGAPRSETINAAMADCYSVARVLNKIGKEVKDG